MHLALPNKFLDRFRQCNRIECGVHFHPCVFVFIIYYLAKLHWLEIWKFWWEREQILYFLAEFTLVSQPLLKVNYRQIYFDFRSILCTWRNVWFCVIIFLFYKNQNVFSHCLMWMDVQEKNSDLPWEVAHILLPDSISSGSGVRTKLRSGINLAYS